MLRRRHTSHTANKPLGRFKLTAAVVALLLLVAAAAASAEPQGEPRQVAFYGNGGVWYPLPDRNIVPGSESVRIGPRPLVRGLDYLIDPSRGVITFTEPVSNLRRIYISYRVNPSGAGSNSSLQIGAQLPLGLGLKAHYASTSTNSAVRSGFSTTAGTQMFGVSFFRSAPLKKDSKEDKKDGPEAAQQNNPAQNQQNTEKPNQQTGISYRALWFTSTPAGNPTDRLQQARDPISSLWYQLGPDKAKQPKQPSGSLFNVGVQGLPFLGGTFEAGYENIDGNVDSNLLMQQFTDPAQRSIAEGMAKRIGTRTWNLAVQDAVLLGGKMGFAATEVADGRDSASFRKFSYETKDFGFGFNQLSIGREFSRLENSLLPSPADAAKLKGASLTNLSARANLRGVGQMTYSGLAVKDGAEGASQQNISLQGKRGKVVLNTQKVSANFNRDKKAAGLQGEPEKQKGQSRTNIAAEYQLSKSAKWSATHQYLRDQKSGKTDTHTVNTVDLQASKTRISLQNELTGSKTSQSSSSSSKTSIDVAGTYAKGLSLHTYAEAVKVSDNGKSASSNLVRTDFALDRGKGLKMAGVQQFEKTIDGGRKSSNHFEMATPLIGRLTANAVYDGWVAKRDGARESERILKSHVEGPITRALNLKFDQYNRWMTGASKHIVRTTVVDGKVAGISFRNTNYLKNQGPGNYESSNNLEFQWQKEILVGNVPTEVAALQNNKPAASPQPQQAATAELAPQQPQNQQAQPAPQPATAQTAAAPQEQKQEQPKPEEPDKVQIGVQGNILNKNLGDKGTVNQTNVALNTSYLRGKEKAIGFDSAYKRSRVAEKNEDKQEIATAFMAKLPLDSMLAVSLRQVTDKDKVVQSMSSVGIIRPLAGGLLQLEVGSAKTSEQMPSFSTSGFSFASREKENSKTAFKTMVRTYAGPKGEKVACYEHSFSYKPSQKFTLTARTYRNPESKDPKQVYTAVSGYGMSVSTVVSGLNLSIGFNNEKTLQSGLNALTANFALSGALGKNSRLDLSYTGRMAAYLVKDVPTHYLKLSFTREVDANNKLSLSGEYKVCRDRDPQTRDFRNLTARIDLTRVF